MNKILIRTATVLTTENSTGPYIQANNEAHSQQILQSTSNAAQQEDNNIVAEENNSEVMIYECLLCGLICNKKARLIHHINVTHTNRSKHTMICRCHKCNLYFSVLSEFKLHKCILPFAYDLSVADLQQNESDIDINMNVTSDMHKKELNLADKILDFCVLLEAKHKVPKVAINEMANFLGYENDFIGHENDVSRSVTDTLRKLILSKNGVYLIPKQVDLPDGSSGYVISIIDIIQNLAKFNEILFFLKKNVPLSDIVTDIMQGQRYRTHPGQTAHKKKQYCFVITTMILNYVIQLACTEICTKYVYFT